MGAPNIIPINPSRQKKMLDGHLPRKLHTDKKQQLISEINQTINNIEIALKKLRSGDSSPELLQTIGDLQERAETLKAEAKGLMAQEKA